MVKPMKQSITTSEHFSGGLLRVGMVQHQQMSSQLTVRNVRGRARKPIPPSAKEFRPSSTDSVARECGSQ